MPDTLQYRGPHPVTEPQSKRQSAAGDIAKAASGAGRLLFMLSILLALWLSGYAYGRIDMEESAVQHGAARYNPQTAEFEWIDRGKTE